jgi:hypothetical protein
LVLPVDVVDHLAAAHPEHDIVAILSGNIGNNSAKAATTNYRDLTSWHVFSNAAELRRAHNNLITRQYQHMGINRRRPRR